MFCLEDRILKFSPVIAEAGTGLIPSVPVSGVPGANPSSSKLACARVKLSNPFKVAANVTLRVKVVKVWFFSFIC